MPLDIIGIRRFIVSNEGWYRTTYHDNLGNPTVGVGFNLNRPGAQQEVEGLGLNFNSVYTNVTTPSLSDQQVDVLFTRDVNRAIAAARNLIPGFDNLSAGRQTVLVDMALNLGAAGLAGFHDMLAAVNGGDWARAANEMTKSNWFHQVGARAGRDVAAMQSGNMPTSGGGGPKPLDAKPAKEAKEGKEADKGKDAKEGKEADKGKDAKEGKEADKGKDAKESKEADKGKDAKEGKEADKGKDTKEGKDGKEAKEGKDAGDKGKEGKDGEKDMSDKGKDGKDGEKDMSDKGKDGKDGEKDMSDKGKDGKDGEKDMSDKGKEGKDGKDDKDGKEDVDLP